MKTRFIIAASLFSLLMISPSWAQDSRYGNHRNHGHYVKEDVHHNARIYPGNSRKHRGHPAYHRNERYYHTSTRQHFAIRGRHHYRDSHKERRSHHRRYLSTLDHHEDYRRHDVKTIAGTILLNEARYRQYR
jgi:hypothetical protein